MYRAGGGIPRQQTFASDLYKFYRPFSACDLERYRFKAPNVEHRGRNENFGDVDKKLRKRYDYLDRAPTDRLANILRNRERPAENNLIGKYQRYDSLGCLNRREVSRPSFFNERSQPHQRALIKRQNYRPSVRNLNAMNLVDNRRQQIKHENFYSNRDLVRKPPIRNYPHYQDNIQNLTRRNQSIEQFKLKFDRLGHHAIRPDPNQQHLNKKSRRQLPKRNEILNSPLGLNLGVILTQSIVQGPNGRVY